MVVLQNAGNDSMQLPSKGGHIPCRLADSVYSSRAAGGVNYFLCDFGNDLAVSIDIPSQPVVTCIVFVSFHLAVSPNACMYILAQPVAPCIFCFIWMFSKMPSCISLRSLLRHVWYRSALRTVSTVHGLLVETVKCLSAMLCNDLDIQTLVRFVLELSLVLCFLEGPVSVSLSGC
ncbi:uncharacterized protein BT62DRAFT_1009280 [Guyanagaster necrorhizus]|uniref:Uncharacterized protein n=1 Tax=Guyanagaster necrorhizus TaxID=856835 RepID=A0A9P7VMJ5_9AGAR|nr:uncharacterized protein BT62DRAFT_1009280 [Guyanagaster necrorhizus MCA 3950]KAG7443469.1 hypothetical protein BT62DRAFT_1009280 [Guyanagaster necrorhizus MCA 3950]